MAKKGKKKGGKLPIILVVAVVLMGGGYFMMGKGKGEEKPEKPPVELGAIEDLGGEFLVNLGDKRTFLKCKISVHVAKEGHVSDPAADDGGGHGGGDHTYAMARSAVIELLSSKTIEDITAPDGIKFLKREMAAAINHAVHHEEEEESTEEDSKSKKKKKEEDSHGDDGHGDGHAEIDHEWLDELGWDSEEGPVLKVYFTDFAYQKY